MLNTIWFFMIFIGMIYGALTGNLEEINNIIFKEAQEGVTFAISLIGIMSFWLGIMNIAQRSGLIKSMCNIFRPIMRIIFPDIPKSHPAENWILMNFIANMFGIGNGATAFGLKAMKELNNLNYNKKKATSAMAMFLIINMSSLQLVPLTIIKIRQDYGSSNPSFIIGPTILATSLSTLIAIIIGKMFERRN
ncbi:spore maturation protein A [Keratinibaculum paraultunense]|uniref:Spore maturation protein A n=1 Tax=Keratinibaculum paraultunense TaxID=1278232 RepID=A0A4R3KV40_9FIRM|nr:nucleoside recognition domain-containing protein [Keratinibaculum paraultunense]QQY79878.1 spore maturation protein [Keratinibaculum paraultunense]TCS88764.1 spore maturation protein A [Keratinibaculum paraultunense]